MVENRAWKVRLVSHFGRVLLERSPVSFAPNNNLGATAVHMTGRVTPESLFNGDVGRYDGVRGVGFTSAPVGMNSSATKPSQEKTAGYGLFGPGPHGLS